MVTLCSGWGATAAAVFIFSTAITHKMKKNVMQTLWQLNLLKLTDIYWFSSLYKPMKKRFHMAILQKCSSAGALNNVSNVINLAWTSPPAVMWWDWDRWVVWSMTPRRLKEKLRNGWDWTFPQPCWPALLYWSGLGEKSAWALYCTRCWTPWPIDLETHLTARCKSFV